MAFFNAGGRETQIDLLEKRLSAAQNCGYHVMPRMVMLDLSTCLGETKHRRFTGGGSGY